MASGTYASGSISPSRRPGGRDADRPSANRRRARAVVRGRRGSPPKRRCQNAWLSTATGGPSGLVSASANARPMAGVTPKDWNRPEVVCATVICSAPSLPSRFGGNRLDERQRLERLRARAPLEEVQRMHRDGRLRIRRLFPERDEATGIRIRQRTQQHRVDEAEDRGVRADAEREREHGDRREARALAEASAGRKSCPAACSRSG